MNLVLPVTTHDAERFKLRNDLLIQFGGLLDHTATIIHAPSVKKVAQAEYDRLRGVFGDVQIVQITAELSDPKPVVNQNVMFYHAVMALGRLRNNQPWIYLEADAAPTQKDWANRLQNAYRASGVHYFGNIVQMPVIINGQLEIESGEEMMMGVGVYPPDMLNLDNGIRPLVIDLGKQVGNPGVPFDIYLRGEMRLKGWANTDLIADQWNTQKYRAVQGGFECESAPTDRLVRNRGGFVSSKALVIHGCKDDSLYQILKGNTLYGWTVERVNGGFSHNIENADAPEPAKTPEKVSEKAVEAEVPTLTEEELDIQRQVEERLARGSLRLNVFADELGKTTKEVSDILAKVGFAVQKPSGWVKKA